MSSWLYVFALVAMMSSSALAQGPRLYQDDPLKDEPAPLPVADLRPRPQ
jgi:hypothetical protein